MTCRSTHSRKLFSVGSESQEKWSWELGLWAFAETLAQRVSSCNGSEDEEGRFERIGGGQITGLLWMASRVEPRVTPGLINGWD